MVKEEKYKILLYKIVLYLTKILPIVMSIMYASNTILSYFGIDYTCWDVYVALNAQYHDYINLYKECHPNATEDELNDKLVKSAITFWFKDEDYNGCKVWNYFKTCEYFINNIVYCFLSSANITISSISTFCLF